MQICTEPHALDNAVTRVEAKYLVSEEVALAIRGIAFTWMLPDPYAVLRSFWPKPKMDQKPTARMATVAVPRKTRKPIVSVSAVTKMLEASAGSILHHLKPNGMATPERAPII